jgi:hypothetical protein
MNQKMLIYALSSAAVAVLSFFVEPVREGLHSIIDIFVKGYSPVRVYILSGTLAFLFLIASLPLPKIQIKGIKTVLVTSMIAVFSFGVFMQVWFDHTYDIPTYALSLSVDGGKITGTAFSHIHIGKSITHILVSPIISTHSPLDSGAGISPFIPNFFKIIFGVLLVIFFVTLILWYIKKIEDEKNDTARFTFGFIFVAAPLLIRVVDGGFFAAGTILFIGAFLAIIFGSTAKKFLGIVCSAFVAQMIWYIFFPRIIASTISDLTPYFIITPTILAFYIAIFGNIVSLNKKLITAWTCIIFLGVALLYRIGFLEARYTNVFVNDAFVASYNLKNDKTYSLRGSVGTLHIYEYKGATTTVNDLVIKENIPDEYFPVSAPGKTCSKESTGRAMTFRLLSENFVSDTDVPTIGVKIAFKEISSPVSTMHAYRGVLLEPECLPQPLSVLAEAIGLAGGKNFIISERQ